MSERSGGDKLGATWIGFLAMAFLIVGMTGLFASIAAPIPLQRAVLRDAALDDALASLQAPDPAAALQALRPRLGDSAAAVDGAVDALPARVQAERAAMRARFTLESDTIGARLHMLVIIVTLAGALFGAAVIGSANRRR